MSLEVIHERCAGIDVGSKSHYVAINQDLKDVREFGVYAEDLKELSGWLMTNDVTTVALESTGNYWQNLYIELINSGLKVVLTSGKYTKNVSRKKTDVLDCQWIQKLHSLGLLSSSFLPDSTTEKLRTLTRHRANMIDLKAETSHKMQKYLKLLNFRLDVVVRDVTGLTGMKIIRAICGGDLDPESLAKHRHYNCRKSETEIAKSLVSNGREDYLFGLQQEYDRYEFYLSKISACDSRIGEYLDEVLSNRIDVVDDLPEAKPYKRQNKNSIKGVDLNIVSYQYFGGVDLYEIPGVSHSTVLSIMSEVGSGGFGDFATAKHFANWLRLAPNNKISGGKILSHRVPRGSSRLKIALRNTAHAIGNMKQGDLNRFFRKIAFKKGRQAAITATARKLAVIIWNMVTKKEPYQPKTAYTFEDQRRKEVADLRRRVARLGFDPNELGIFSRPKDAKAHAQRSVDNQ